MNHKLKSCPFCGSDVISVDQPMEYSDEHLIECSECRARLDGKTLLHAIKAWNARAEPKKAVYSCEDCILWDADLDCRIGSQQGGNKCKIFHGLFEAVTEKKVCPECLGSNT